MESGGGLKVRDLRDYGPVHGRGLTSGVPVQLRRNLNPERDAQIRYLWHQIRAYLVRRGR